MYISSSTIEKIKESMNILEIIAEYIPLKKRGQNWWALSPFTEEKIPSLSVSEEKGIFKCFSSGKGGNSITFLMEIEQMTYTEALVHLAKKYHITLEKTTPQNDEYSELEKEKILIVLEFAKNYYRKNLHSLQDQDNLLALFLENRCILKETAERFELGYSKKDQNSFFKAAEKNQFTKEIMQSAGLILQKGIRVYDRFRDRVMFPIHNIWGKVVGFGCRTLQESEIAKYINSPESKVYHKSKLLYGLFQAKDAIHKAKNCYLVEGYIDVITLHQAGIKNTIASSGTSLTKEQIRIIQRFVSCITLLYDGDTAGIKAILRNIDLILEQGLKVKIVPLPEGDDPDSYLKKIGANAFRMFLDRNSVSFMVFKTQYFLKKYKKNDSIQRSEWISNIIRSIIKIPSIIERHLFYKEYSKLLDIDIDILEREGDRLLLGKRKNYTQNIILPKRKNLAKKINPIHTQEKFIVYFLLKHGNRYINENQKVRTYILKELEDITFQHPIYRDILDTYRRKEDIENLDSNFFMTNGTESMKKAIVDTLTVKYSLPGNYRYEVFITGMSREIDNLDNLDNLGGLIYEHILFLKFLILEKICWIMKERVEKLDPHREDIYQNLPLIAKKKIEIAEELGLKTPGWLTDLK